MRWQLTTLATPRALARLSTGLSLAVLGGLIIAVFARDAWVPAPRPNVPIEVLRTKPHPLPLPRGDQAQPLGQTN